ncbi:MAG: hypothetical protein WD599_00770 [Balneolaceae bacterium]
MSYALRNTIILLLVFTLIAGVGYSYIYFFQERTIDELYEKLGQLEEEFDQMQRTAELYPELQSRFEHSENFVESFDKTLFQTNNPDRIFKFLSEINVLTPQVEFNYIFNDSTLQEQYGVIQSSINGDGPYRSVVHFLNRIENSMPIQKINELILSPIQSDGGTYGYVSFSFELNSYYDRSDFFDTGEEELSIVSNLPSRFHNPFFPLIREIGPNVDNLVNIENSRLIGISSSRIFLRDQNDRLVNLSVRDPVYLGSLESIDIQEGRATFRLNKGGIIDIVTLEVQ